MLRFSVGAVQGLPLAHVFSAFFINPLKYSAAEAAVRLAGEVAALRRRFDSVFVQCQGRVIRAFHWGLQIMAL